jgi:beta-glucosidase
MVTSAFGRELAKYIPEGSRANLGTSSSYGVATTLKHWIGYGLPDSGRDRSNANVSEEEFDRTVFPGPRNVLLSSDPLIVMVNSGPMNGIPLHADKIRVQRLLRNRLGFQGLILSDYDDFVRVFNRYKYASNLEDAFALVLDAGLDVHLTENRVDVTLQTLQRMVQSGRIKESRIDESVRRVLNLKNTLGLLEPDYGAIEAIFFALVRDLSS